VTGDEDDGDDGAAPVELVLSSGPLMPGMRTSRTSATGLLGIWYPARNSSADRRDGRHASDFSRKRSELRTASSSSTTKTAGSRCATFIVAIPGRSAGYDESRPRGVLDGSRSAAMRSDDRLADRKPEAGACSGRAERIEHPFDNGGIDSRPESATLT
jgi:hypothetical protein